VNEHASAEESRVHAEPAVGRVGFNLLARPGWFRDAYHSSMLVRFATTIGLRREQLIEKYNFPIILPFGRPVAIGVTELAGGTLPVTDSLLFGDHDGEVNFHINQREMDAPKATVLAFRTPLVVDGYDTGQSAAAARLDAAAGLVSIHAGRNAIRAIVFEGVLAGETDGWSLYSAVHRVPQPVEGPYMEADLWKLVEEAAVAIDAAPRDVKDRVRLALEFIGRALQSSEAFLFYWTAFELLSGGAQGTRADLAKAYGLKHAQHVDHATGFGKVCESRHKLIHSGIAVSLSAAAERYVQLLLIDLVRLKLGLEPQFHALHFQLNQLASLPELGVKADWGKMFPGG
jgi:hypothetical protein